MKDEINAAIAAHSQWKVRLKGAIDTGKLDVPIGTIRVDDQCAFGKWLHGDTLPAEVKASPHYAKVRELHARFHQVAAAVAEAALAGRKAEAEASMGITGEYGRASADLTRAMMDWLASVR